MFYAHPSQLSLELPKFHVNPYQRAAQQIQINSNKTYNCQQFMKHASVKKEYKVYVC